MKTAQCVQQIRRIIALDPVMEKILLANTTLEDKRYKLRSHLSNLLLNIYDKTHDMAALEWVVSRDTIWVLRNMLSARSEELAGFSLLAYLEGLLHGHHRGPGPSPGFIAELRHLVKGIKGLTKLYTEKPPAFLKHSGRTAAKMRSTDLSRMARKAQAFIDRYPCGMDDSLIREHSSNRQRLFGFFNITDLEWNDWTWHVRHIIRDPQILGELIKLSQEEEAAITIAGKEHIPFGITPYTISLMDPENRGIWDTAIRAQVIPPMPYIKRIGDYGNDPGCSNDFMVEGDTSPIDGITRRYPGIVILKPVLTCPQICVYCQRNGQIQDVTSSDAALGEKKLARALDWIGKTREISEVLVTGGDPLILSDERLDNILSRLAQMDHVLRIRIGTRTPVTLPQRITESLVRTITRFHEPGRREVVIITHFEHPTEITPEAMQAVQRFRLFGVEVYNQMVYTYYNSRKFEAANLRQQLRLIGVTPYYTFNTKGKEETDNYRVPIARLLQEQQEEARLFPGTVRTDEIVFNVPRLGKNYLMAAQNRDMIAILPDGRRVYEFHPWEKRMALMDTYVYTDVSIDDYLKRLKQDGEQPKDYNSIWYYY
ncbi:MAG: KamA family radical SAM protein [Desulfobacterales bacterium]|nr:KamA family radical SAM protein [Desulfobacterales bacterium]